MKRGCLYLLSAVLFLAIICSGCRKQDSDSSGSADSSADISYTPGKTTVLVPEYTEADAGNDFFSLDLSHTDQGYLTALLTKEDTKISLQITGPDDVVYNYFLNTPDVCTTFPLTAGDGTYVILAFEYVGDNQYATLFSCTPDVALSNEFLPFLYPNQYVNFTEESESIRLAGELSQDAETDLDALTLIYEYVTENISYDDEKAATVQSGYLPDIDETLASGKGICFDYASLTTAMLRSLSIPSRLEIGYSGDVMHAWIDVYIESKGWVENAIEFNGDEWRLMDPTFGAAGDNEAIREYIGDSSNYTTLYVR